MDVYIISYKKNGKWNEMLKNSKKRFKELGYKVFLVEGYNLKENPEIKPTHVVYLNLRDKVLPLVKNKYNDGFLVAEDDAYPQDILTPQYLLERLKTHNYLNNIIRVGYQKKLKQKGPYYPLGYYLVGTQLLWFPKKQMNKLKAELYKSNPQHLNGYFSKMKNLKVKILDEEIQKKNKYVLELEHVSATTGKTRKGLKINKNNFLKNKVRSKKLK
jgi:hypothetical protein